MCGCPHVHVYEMCQAVLSCGVVYCTIFSACIPRTELASILMAANYFIMAMYYVQYGEGFHDIISSFLQKKC